MEANVDISLQISQLNKTGNSKRHKGCAMGMVSTDRKIRYSTFLSKKELDKIIEFYKDKFPLKTTYVRIHSIMVFLCLEPYLENIELIKLCQDFKSHILTREMYNLFPILQKYKIKWIGGKGNKSPADKHANRIRKHPEYANNILTLEKIKKMEAPRKSK